MKVEMFHTPDCPRCAAARDELRAAAQAVVKDLEWLDVDIFENFNRASRTRCADAARHRHRREARFRNDTDGKGIFGCIDRAK